MKKIILILFTILLNTFCINAHNAQITIKLKSKYLKNGSISYEDTILIKKTKKTNTINLNIDEPQRLILSNSKAKQYIIFFIEQGKHTISIDLDKRTIASETSLLCKENNETIYIRKYYDSINGIYINKIKNNYDTLGLYREKIDSINKEYHKTYYNWCLKHTKSFISLSFLNFMTYSYLSIGITKEEINTLFNSLDISLHNNPSYKKSKEYIAEYINNPNYKIEEPPTPLWNPR